MNKDYSKKLVEKYPIIFQEYGGDPRHTCMAFGIECGDGWFDLIEQLCEDITKLIGNKNCKIIAQQVKEKFGGLRFYYYVQIEQTPLSKAGYLIRKYMFSKRLGKEYWAIIGFRKKIFKTTYEKISDRVDKAEIDSYKICEICGEPGKSRGKGWVKTMCKICDKKFDEGKRPWEDNWNEEI